MTKTLDAFGMKGDTLTFDTRNLIELQLISTSKGNQRKWYVPERHGYVKEQFFYQGKLWKDYLVEVISSEIARQLPEKCAKVLEQHKCEIRDYAGTTMGVFSIDFAEDSEFVSFQRITESDGLYFDERASIGDKWDFVLESVQKSCGLDYTDYLLTMVLLDYLLGNEDRHLNNFGLLSNVDGFSLAPLFDFGIGLFEHDLKYVGCPFRECLSMMYSKPFGADNQKVVDYLASRYNLSEYLPRRLDLSGVEMPSKKAGSYVRNRCMLLGIELEGVI